MAKKKKTDNKEEKKKFSISDIVAVSDSDLTKVASIAFWMTLVSIITNSSLVGIYAFASGIDAPISSAMSLTVEDGKFNIPFTNWGLNWVSFIDNAVTFFQVVMYVMAQLCTDFLLLFAAGLSFYKFKLTPSLSISLWIVCIIFTALTKAGFYGMVKEARINEMRAVEKPSYETEIALNWIEQYRGEEPKAIPPDASLREELVLSLTGQVAALENAIPQYEKLRDNEEKTGIGSRFKEYSDKISLMTDDIVNKQTQVVELNVSASERISYESNLKLVNEWEARSAPTIVTYDQQYYIWFRVIISTIVGVLSVLSLFAFRKLSAEVEKKKATVQKREETIEKRKAEGVYDIKDAEYEEAVVEMEALPDFEADTADEQNNEITADYATQTPQSSDTHPDRTGDDYGVGIDGTKGSLENADYDEYGADGDLEPDTPASEPDEGEQGPDKDDRSV